MHKLYFTVEMETLTLCLMLGMVVAMFLLVDKTKKLGKRLRLYKERLERLELGSGDDVADRTLERPDYTGN